MTPDLERAVAAMLAEDEDEVGSSSYTHLLRAALRALENPSPEVLEAMARVWWGTKDQLSELVPYNELHEDFHKGFRRDALASWRAGLNAILAAEGE